MATTINASTSAGLVSTADTSGVLQLQAQNTTVLNAELGKALALQGATSTTGCGIAFPATQVTSTDANTLDDYEEGTWTPSLGGTATYASRNGYYVKIGQLVFISMNLQVTAIGTGSATVITGLPFAQSGGGQTTGLSVGIYSTLASTVVSIQPYVAPTTSSITIYSATAAGAANAQYAIFQNGARLDITGCYTTT